MLIAPEEALEIVLSNVRPLKARQVALGEALHGRLAEAIRSDRDQPPTDRSSVDGYAVRTADLRKVPARLRLVGEVAAGSAVRVRVGPATAVAILTGATVPPGADAVVPVESAQADGDAIVVRAGVRRGANIRRRGEEAERGDVLLEKGHRMGPAEIGVAAMVGMGKVRIFPRPRVAVLCTGDELRHGGDRIGPEQIRDGNGPALLAALAAQGIGNAVRTLVGDDPGAVASRLRLAARTHDLVLITGGVSVGRYDFVPEAIRRIGGKVRFHGVKMKPGKPLLYATRPANRHLFGLPGNPVSVLTGFHEFVLPALRRLGGAGREECRRAMWLRLASPARSDGRRRYYALARLVETADGPAAAPVRSKGSADLIAACGADGVIVIPDGTESLPVGARVEFHAWKPMP
jgi:molybdopterin molybdotransferase